MTERELRAVAEAIFTSMYPFSWDVVKDRTPQENLGAEVKKCKDAAEAVIQSSDSQYVKRLVEALKNLRHGIFRDEAAVNECIDNALNSLPGDLR